MRVAIKKSGILGFWCVAAALCCVRQASGEELSPNIFPDGTFSAVPGNARLPQGWLLWENSWAKVGLVNDRGQRYLLLTNDNAATNVGVYKQIRLNPNWQYLIVRTKMAAKNLHVGQIDWQNARVDLQFEDAQYQRVGGYPGSPILKSDTDWKSFEMHLKIPEGAVYFRLEPSMLNTTGTIGVGDIQVFVTDTPPAAPNPAGNAGNNATLPGVDFTPPAFSAPSPNAGVGANPGDGAAFPEGAFDTVPVVDGLPQGWLPWENSRNKVKLVDDNGERQLHLVSDGTTFVGVFAEIKLKSEWHHISLSTRIKAKGLKPTRLALASARIAYTFEDDKYKKIGALPAPLLLDADTDWKPLKVDLQIPLGAAALKFEPSVFSSGEMDIDAITVTGSAEGDYAPAHPIVGVFNSGAFDASPINGKLPDGWQVAEENAAKIAFIDDDGRHCLKITNDNPAQTVSATAQLKLDPQWKKLVITTHMTTQNFKPGKENWHNARLPVRFVNDKDEKVGNLPLPLELARNSGWRTMIMQVDIPPGATYLKLQAGLYFATGTLKLDDIIIEPQ